VIATLSILERNEIDGPSGYFLHEVSDEAMTMMPNKMFFVFIVVGFCLNYFPQT
jgi:hypothetical protein